MELVLEASAQYCSAFFDSSTAITAPSQLTETTYNTFVSVNVISILYPIKKIKNYDVEITGMR